MIVSPTDTVTSTARFSSLTRNPSKLTTSARFKEFYTPNSNDDEISEMEDVDDKRHTHHPVRKYMRQLLGTFTMMISSSQILYCYVCEPDALPKPYLSFLITHGGIRDLQPQRARRYLNIFGPSIRTSGAGISKYRKGDTFLERLPTEYPHKLMAEFGDFLSQSPNEFVMCSIQHPYTTSCAYGLVHATIGEAKRAFALYAPLNLVMTIIFRGKKVLKDPKKSLRAYIKSTIRSVAFLTAYVVTAWSVPCLLRNIRGTDEKWIYYFNGILAGSMVLLEQPGRRLELGMYCLPRAIESLWNSLRSRNLVRNFHNGELIYFTLSTGILMTLYQTDPGSIHEGYRKFMYRFFGLN